jgi:imidazole glycerol phosphate synthase subunit HisF
MASLYGRNNLFDLIKKITKNIFIPITLGGGIRSLKDIENALNSGADKVSINSKALEMTKFLNEAILNFGEFALNRTEKDWWKRTIMLQDHLTQKSSNCLIIYL